MQDSGELSRARRLLIRWEWGYFMDDVLQIIKKDHDDASKMFSEIGFELRELEVPVPDVRDRFRRLYDTLTAHLRAEEEAVYGPLQLEVSERELRDFAFEGEEEHTLIHQLLGKL